MTKSTVFISDLVPGPLVVICSAANAPVQVQLLPCQVP